MVRIGIIGAGGIANSAHIPLIENSNGGRVTAICDVDPMALQRTGDRLGIDPRFRFEHYEDLIACPEVDAVEICTPNYLHIPMAVAAVKAGKPVNIEKPLSLTTGDTQPLADALQANPVPNMMCFSYRFRPAVRYAKEILQKGMLGDILSVNVEYLKDSAFWEGRRLDWRFVKKYAGTGVLGDLGVHLIDMAQFLVGDVKSVCARAGIVVKQRMKLDSDELADVETDDYCNFMAEFEGGAQGMFTITRCAIGHANTIRYDIFGTKGVLSFNLNQPDELTLCVGEVDVETKGMHTVKVPKKYHITQEQMFIDLVQNRPCTHLPTVADGIRCQRVLDALLDSSENKKWVTIEA